MAVANQTDRFAASWMDGDPEESRPRCCGFARMRRPSSPDIRWSSTAARRCSDFQESS
jgi:hypothetical protein